MTQYFRCDGHVDDQGEFMGRPKIELRGISRGGDGGIMIPDSWDHPIKHFCSRECFFRWIREALEQE